MKQIPFIAIYLVLCSTVALACPQCRPVVKAEVYNQEFVANLGLLLLPLGVLLAIGMVIYFSDGILATLRKNKGERPWLKPSNVGR